MPLFNVTVREHAYTGRFYNDVVTADSCEEALQLAAKRVTAPQPPRDSKLQLGFNIAVREPADPGRFYKDVVTADSCEEALQLAAKRVTAPRPPPGSEPQPDAANRRRCADVWVYSLLHCELEEGHDPPHMAVASGYGRPMRWVRDDRGLAHAFPEPATRPSRVSPDHAAAARSGRGISPGTAHGRRQVRADASRMAGQPLLPAVAEQRFDLGDVEDHTDASAACQQLSSCSSEPRARSAGPRLAPVAGTHIDRRALGQGRLLSRGW